MFTKITVNMMGQEDEEDNEQEGTGSWKRGL